MEPKNKTVMKSMNVLNLFTTHERLSLNEMIDLTKAPKTTIYRMVRSLEEMGLLSKEEDGKYSLGLIFLQFGQLVADRLDIRHIALPVMRTLRDRTGEATNLIVRDGDEAIYIEKIDTDHPVRVYTRVGRRAPLYAGACPRSLLAFLPDAEMEAYLSRAELKPIGSGTMVDPNQLRSVLLEARKAGYTVSHSELEDDSSAVAAPIFNHQRQVVAGISLAGPTGRFGDDKLNELVIRIKEAARDISVQLGYLD